jgi:serine/threonine protein kinase
MGGLTGTRLGPYQILEQIGRGGMAAVYRAHDTTRDRFVALKLVAPHLTADPNFEQRFRREAKLLMRLKHPHIIPVEDAGEADDYAYLVMPFLRVGTLTDWLRQGPTSVRHGARLMAQMSSALMYAHDRGIVHRDVKPSNILLDDQGNALLSDFGLARFEEPGASLTGSMMVGTPAFMSPEQVRGDRAGPLSDQYSLGVILYLLTTGQLPFDGDVPIAVALQQLNEPMPLVRAVSPNVPEAVERVILKSTAKLPNDRFESVAEMNGAFQAAVAHALDPSSTPAPLITLPDSVQRTLSLSEKVGPPRRFRPRWAVVAGLALLLALAYPVLASGRGSLLELFSPASDGTPASAAELSEEQLRLLSGTIEAMSTDLAGSRADLMEAEQVQTAVMATLMASGVFSQMTPGPTSTDHPGAASPTSDPGVRVLTPVSLSTPHPTATPSASLADLTPTPVLASPGPTATNTSGPSSTPALSSTPTDVPPIDPCAGLIAAGFLVNGSEVSWEIVNGGLSGVSISRILLDWPAANLELKKVRLAGSQIWNAGDNSPPTDIQSGWKGNRSLSAGAAKELSFEFGTAAASSGYDLLVEFDTGCQLLNSGG